MKHCLEWGRGGGSPDGWGAFQLDWQLVTCLFTEDRLSGIFKLKYITCLAGKRALNNLTSSCGACFRFLFASLVLSWCPVLFSNIFFCCFLTLEKLKIANKASCDNEARFLQGLLFKYLLYICCLELLNMHGKSDFCSTFCVDLGHSIPSLCRAEQIGRSVRSFECTRNCLSFRKDLCCKPPIIFCQLRASKQNLSLCCCVLLYFCPQTAFRFLVSAAQP